MAINVKTEPDAEMQKKIVQSTTARKKMEESKACGGVTPQAFGLGADRSPPHRPHVETAP